jgi:hypothetical protein
VEAIKNHLDTWLADARAQHDSIVSMASVGETRDNCHIQTMLRLINTNMTSQTQWIASSYPKEIALPYLEAHHEMLIATTYKLLIIDPTILSDVDRQNLSHQISLKKRNGGLGVINFSDSADAIRLGALIAGLPRVLSQNLGAPGSPALPELNQVIQRLLLIDGLNEASKRELEDLQLINNRQVPLPQGQIAERLSKRITAYIHKLNAKKWEESLKLETSRDLEIFRSVTQPEAGLPFSANPREFPIHDAPFVFYAKRHLLSLKIMNQSDALCHLCKEPLGADMEHVVCCKNVGKNTLHSAVVAKTAIASQMTLKNTHVSVEREPSLAAYVRPGVNVQKPRSDIKLRNHIANKTTHVDFRMQTIKLEATAENPSVQIGEVQKLQFYNTNYDLATAGADMVAAVIDSRGRWGKQLKEWVQKVAKMGSIDHRDYARKVNFFRTSIAVAHAAAVGKLISDFLRNQM